MLKQVLILSDSQIAICTPTGAWASRKNKALVERNRRALAALRAEGTKAYYSPHRTKLSRNLSIELGNEGGPYRKRAAARAALRKRGGPKGGPSGQVAALRAARARPKGGQNRARGRPTGPPSRPDHSVKCAGSSKTGHNVALLPQGTNSTMAQTGVSGPVVVDGESFLDALFASAAQG